MLNYLTKRMILSHVNGIFDPLGLVSRFTVRSKILMRRLWNQCNSDLGWDDPIPLVVRQKWHVEKRNVCVGDIVIIQDSNAVHGEWKLGRVIKVIPSNDGLIRRCQIQYKLCKESGEMARKYTIIERAVQRLVVLKKNEF